MKKDIFEILMENALNERLDDVVLQNKEYQNKLSKIDNWLECFGQVDRKRINELTSLYMESSYLYGKITYEQGMRDCVVLLGKMGMLKE